MTETVRRYTRHQRQMHPAFWGRVRFLVSQILLSSQRKISLARRLVCRGTTVFSECLKNYIFRTFRSLKCAVIYYSIILIHLYRRQSLIIICLPRRNLQVFGRFRTVRGKWVAYAPIVRHTSVFANNFNIIPKGQRVVGVSGE